MNKQVELDDVISIIKEKLNAGGKVVFTPSGTSMLPMLRDGEDAVVLEKPSGRLHLSDVALYVRGNGQYVLHRVVGFETDGSYIMCGDNQVSFEHGIGDNSIIAVMTAFFRKGKPYNLNSLRYRAYINLWFYIRPFRSMYGYAARAARRLKGSTGKAYDKSAEDPKGEGLGESSANVTNKASGENPADEQ